MKQLLSMTCMGTVALLLCACVDEERHHGYAGGYGYDGSMDVWYDGFYGPYPGGYWDGDVFVYHDRARGEIRDGAHHFRHGNFGGAQGFHSTPHAMGATAHPMGGGARAEPQPR